VYRAILESRFTVVLLLICIAAPLVAQELPPPPPEVPAAVPGEPPPFDPAGTHEATPMEPFDFMIPGPEQTTLTLFEAILLSWNNRPDVLQALGELRLREGNVVSERSALLPTINVRSNYSHVTTNSAGGGGGSVIVGDQVIAGGGGGSSSTSDRLSHRIGYTQVLNDWGRSRNLIKQADLLRQASAASLLSTKNDAALDVKVQYYIFLQRAGLVLVAEDDLANRQQQLALAKALYEAGEMAPGDVVRAQSAVSASVVSLNQALLAQETARQDLLLSLGLSPLENVGLERFREPDLPNKNLEYLLEKAVQYRPDLLAAKRQVEARQAGVGAAYALNRPELSTFTGITYQGALDGVQFPTLTAQLSLAFDIYDGGARAGAVTSAEGALLVSQANLRRTELEVQRLVTQVLAQLLTAENNVEAAKAGVGSAREGVRIAEGRYRVALGSLTDVLDAQRASVQAQTDLVNSLNSLNIARARARHALAAPLEEDFLNRAIPFQPSIP
jgi:outer membrane protein TolC